MDEDLLKKAMNIVNKDASFDDMANMAFRMYTSFCNAGFSKGQAMTLLCLFMRDAIGQAMRQGGKHEQRGSD